MKTFSTPEFLFGSFFPISLYWYSLFGETFFTYFNSLDIVSFSSLYVSKINIYEYLFLYVSHKLYIYVILRTDLKSLSSKYNIWTLRDNFYRLIFSYVSTRLFFFNIF